MLRKLLKYDFHAVLKQFAPVWPVVLAAALLNQLVSPSVFSPHYNSMVSVVFSLILVGVLVAMGVLSAVFILRRFYRGLLGDEGYLMHTLPVSPWQLVLSKLLSGLAVTLVSGLVGLAAIYLMFPQDMWRLLGISLGRMLHDLWADIPQPGLFWAEVLVMFLVGAAASVLLAYLAMALGHLAGRHRLAASVAAYIGLRVVLGALEDLLDLPEFYAYFYGRNVERIHILVWMYIGIYALHAVVCFFATQYILSRRLNLE